MFSSNIAKEDIQKLPLVAFDGKIIEIEAVSEVRKAAKYLSEQKILGIDTETKPNFRKGRKNNVALLQISTDDYAFLFKLKKVGIPEKLANILSNKDILKIGLALKDDLRGLKKYNEFEPAGFVDLQTYVKNFGIEDMGLKKITAIVLEQRISKSQQITNWESGQLSDAQKLYAATDAWICLKIYNKLNENCDNKTIKKFLSQ